MNGNHHLKLEMIGVPVDPNTHINTLKKKHKLFPCLLSNIRLLSRL